MREGGIYALPDKREFVVRGCGRDGYTFYSHQAWKGSGSSEYRLTTEGRVVNPRFLTAKHQASNLLSYGMTAI